MPSGQKPLLIALGLGLVAGAVAWSAIRVQERRVTAGWETVWVLCAARDVAEGTELDQEMVKRCEMPSRFVTDSFFRIGPDGALAAASPVGQRVAVPLKERDPILVSHFEPAREADFSTMINPKGRAVTIDVQERNAVGLWVRPNDHVDVIGSFRDHDTQALRTVTLLQNVVVLATGRVTANSTHVADEDRRFQTVTVLVLPEEAEILTLAQEMGTLTLLLRNPEDLDTQEKRSVVDARTVLTGERAQELQQKRYRTIQIIRGNRGTGAAGVAAREE